MGLFDNITNNLFSRQLAKKKQEFINEAKLEAIREQNMPQDRSLDTQDNRIKHLDEIKQYEGQKIYNYELASDSDMILLINNMLKKQAIKDIEVVSNFIMKCDTCGTEFEHEVEICPECHTENLRTPNEKEALVLEEFMKDVNVNDDPLIDIIRYEEEDANIHDELITFIDRKFVNNGTNISYELAGLYRIDPVLFTINKNNRGLMGLDDQNTPQYTCINPDCNAHRKISYNKKCNNCGWKTESADYEIKNKYYSRKEIIYNNKFGTTRGLSPIFILRDKIKQLILQDVNMTSWLEAGRPPKGFMFINTNEPENFAEQIKNIEQKQATNPNYYPLITVNNKEGKKIAENIPLSSDPAELNLTEQRNELRRQIGAVYGVLPLWHGDLTSSGGLNNETQQIVVTDRALEQVKKLHEKTLDKIVKELGVKDYKYEIISDVKRDESAEENLFSLRANNARTMYDMGFEVQYDTDEKDFNFSEEPTRNPYGDQGVEPDTSLLYPEEEDVEVVEEETPITKKKV